MMYQSLCTKKDNDNFWTNFDDLSQSNSSAPGFLYKSNNSLWRWLWLLFWMYSAAARLFVSRHRGPVPMAKDVCRYGRNTWFWQFQLWKALIYVCKTLRRYFSTHVKVKFSISTAKVIKFRIMPYSKIVVRGQFLICQKNDHVWAAQ